MRSFLKKLALVGLGLLSLWLVSISSLIWVFGSHDFARPSDCAIILGAAVYGDKASPIFTARIGHGIDLYRNHLVKKLIFTGGFGQGTSHSESNVGRQLALQAGVPAADILIEERSHTTHENLLEARSLMKSQGLHTAILVSDPLHLKRSSMMAADLGLDAVTSPASGTRYRSLRPKLELLAHEVYFFHHYLLTRK